MKRFAIAGALLVAGMSTALAGERLDPLSGEPFKINPSKAPNGVQMIQILLENLGIKLKDTPCESNAGSEQRSIHHAVAMFFGESLEETRTQRIISGKCEPDGFEFPSGVEETWNCDLKARVLTKKRNSEVSVSTIRFSVKKKTWELIPQAFFCY